MERGVERTGQAAAAASWPQLIVIMLLRLLVISCFVGLLAVIFPGDKLAFYAFMAFAYIATIPYALWLKDRARAEQAVPLQFVVDLAWVTGVVYFTGGIKSDLFLLYPLVILSAGIIAGPVRAVQITVLATLSYALLVVLMARGILLPLKHDAQVAEWGRIAEALGLRFFVFMAFGAASVYVSQRCQFADKGREMFRRVAEIIFRNVHAGLMLIENGGRILMVNNRAGRLLRQDEDRLVGLSLRDFMDGDLSLEPTDTKADAAPCYLKRTDGSRFPARLEVSRVSMPAEALSGGKGDQPVDVLLVAFSDITRLVEAQEQATYTARVKAAAKMASEIAHEIRNPLTSISGSVQLLGILEEKSARGDAGSAQILREERAGIYSRVFAESSRLDRIIERFINHAEFSPEALAKLFEYEKELKTEFAAPGRPEPARTARPT